jgi:hypothetical protein
VLDNLFDAFPFSAKELPKDEGIFRGPRPLLFQLPGPQGLKDLASKIEGSVLLAMSDEDVKKWSDMFPNDEHAVLSIRDSKGLEFADVILVDFFLNLPDAHQRPWRVLMQGKNDADYNLKYPEIETQLKQLYTAITRCSCNFYFAETGISDSGQAFARLLVKEKELVCRRDHVDVEQIIKTPDQWASLGLNYAINAEDSPDRVMFWLPKAVYCFQRAGNGYEELVQKANVHKESAEFREEYRSFSKADLDEDLESFEKTSATHLLELVKENLLVEASILCEFVLPFLADYERESLKKRFVSMLPIPGDR